MDKLTEVHIAAWLACLAFAVVLYNGLAKARKNFKGKEPTPPNGHLELTARDLERRVTIAEGAIVAVRLEVNAERDKVEASSRARSAALYGKMDDLRKEMGASQELMREEMQTGFKDMERALGRLEGRVSAA